MVTMPTEATHDYSLIHGLRLGMDCIWINCVRDDADACFGMPTWSASPLSIRPRMFAA